MKRIIALLMSAVMLLSACVMTLTSCGEADATHYVTFVIEYDGYSGERLSQEVTIELYGEEAPITVENFVGLCKEGYYNGTVFHRIVDTFMVQGGDGDGKADGISKDNKPTIKGEFSENGVDNPILHERGTISMARSKDRDSASTQFFIVLMTSESNTRSLDGEYAAFGKVVKGMFVFDTVSRGINDDWGGGYGYKGTRPEIVSTVVETAEEYERRVG